VALSQAVSKKTQLDAVTARQRLVNQLLEIIAGT